MWKGSNPDFLGRQPEDVDTMRFLGLERESGPEEGTWLVHQQSYIYAFKRCFTQSILRIVELYVKGRHLSRLLQPTSSVLMTAVAFSYFVPDSTFRFSMMVSTADTAITELTQVVPALMNGVAQEVGVDPEELKLILVGNDGQFDVKPFQQLMAHYEKVEWDFVPCEPHHKSRTVLGSPTQTRICPWWLLTAHPRMPFQMISKVLMLERSQIQTHLRDGRRLLQQRSPQVVCREIVSIRESCEPEGLRRFCPVSASH